MELVKKIDQDLIDAMKNHEKLRLTVIREIKAGMKQAVIDQKKEMSDDLAVEVVSRGIKTRKESIKEFEKGNRTDLVDKTKEEIYVLESYLPEQLSKEEILEIIDKVFAVVLPEKPSDMGKVMKEVTPLLKGKADMKEVSEIIKNKLS
ncbi:MAG: GatB/YqeY domain-containing protein [Bacilli bacterium]|nr:GatB/YqeY domain-containing protein [Bacilli bacterium]